MKISHITKNIIMFWVISLMGLANAIANTNPGAGNANNSVVNAGSKVAPCLNTWSEEMAPYDGSHATPFVSRAAQTPTAGGVLCAGSYSMVVNCYGYSSDGCSGESCGWQFIMLGPGLNSVTRYSPGATSNPDKANGMWSKDVSDVQMGWSGTVTLDPATDQPLVITPDIESGGWHYCYITLKHL